MKASMDPIHIAALVVLLVVLVFVIFLFYGDLGSKASDIIKIIDPNAAAGLVDEDSIPRLAIEGLTVEKSGSDLDIKVSVNSYSVANVDVYFNVSSYPIGNVGETQEKVILSQGVNNIELEATESGSGEYTLIVTIYSSSHKYVTQAGIWSSDFVIVS